MRYEPQRLLRRYFYRGERPDRWGWEIRRKSKPLGITMTGDGFQSEMAAKSAGKQALQDFLSDLAKEKNPKASLDVSVVAKASQVRATRHEARRPEESADRSPAPDQS